MANRAQTSTLAERHQYLLWVLSLPEPGQRFDRGTASAASIEKGNWLMAQLEEPLRSTMIERYGLTESHRAMTLKQTGALFGITGDAVRQREQRALRRLRYLVRAKNSPIENLDPDSIWQLGLSAQTGNALVRAGITTIRRLRYNNDSDLLKIRNFGPVALDEARKALTNYDAKGNVTKGDVL